MGTTGLDVARNGDTARKNACATERREAFTQQSRASGGEETDSACEQRYVRPLFSAKISCNLLDKSELSEILFVSFFCFR